MFRHNGVTITDPWRDETGRFEVDPSYYLGSFKSEVMMTFDSYMIESGMDMIDISFVGTPDKVDAELVDAIRNGVHPVDMAMDFIDRAVADGPLRFD